MVSNRDVGPADVTRYVMARFEAVCRDGGVSDLVRFHTQNKYLLMAHDQAGLAELGRMVAGWDGAGWDAFLDGYGARLKAALDQKATTKRHANAIQHMCGRLLAGTDPVARQNMLESMEAYRTGRIRLGEILSAISRVVRERDNRYLAGQTYFLLYCKPGRGILGTHPRYPRTRRRPGPARGTSPA